MLRPGAEVGVGVCSPVRCSDAPVGEAVGFVPLPGTVVPLPRGAVVLTMEELEAGVG